MEYVEKDGEFVTFDQESLYYRSWIPTDPKSMVLYLHGAFSHAGEATYPAEYLATHIDVATYALDLRGWGHWEGVSGHINHRQEMIDDVLLFLNFIRGLHSDLPVVLIGHSMGGLLALRVLMNHQDLFTAALVSSPWIESRVQPPFILRILSGLVSKIWPTFSDEAPFQIDELTHDNSVINQHYREIESGLRKMRATARWFVEIKQMQEEVKENSKYIRLPIIVMQAGQDLLVSENAAKDVYERISSDYKSWQYYPNMYHEIFNESDREDPLSETATFIESHIPTI